MKKLLAILLVLCMTLSCFAIGTFADGDAEPTRESQASKWDGTVYTEGNYTFEGEGTEASPYLLNSAEDVAKLSSNVDKGNKYEGKYFKLTCDLDFDNKEWRGIGFGSTNYFAGNFDGDYHVVYNFALQNAGYNGFFGYAGYGFVLKNFGIASGTITLKNTRSGPLVGFSKGNIEIDNCFNKADIIYNHQGYIGGLLGTIMNPGDAIRIISNCYSDCDITVTSPTENKDGDPIANPNYCVGGLAALINDGTTMFENCYSMANITVNTHNTSITADQDYNVAGLVGCHHWINTIIYEDCAFGGSITYNNSATTDSKIAAHIGNLIGYVYASAKNVSVDDSNVYVTNLEKNIGYGKADNTAKKVDSVTLPLEDEFFIKSNAPTTGGEGGTGTYVPATDAEKTRYEAASKWDGTVYTVASAADVYTFEGKGTEAEPYLLKSADDVAKLAANVRFTSEETNYMGEYFKLTCDLDLQNYEWMGIGGCFGGLQWGAASADKADWDKEMFSGVFLGDNHVIYNFNLADETAAGKAITANGFFGYVGYGEIYDLGIVNGDVEMNGASRCAALIGASRYELTVSNCFNRANLTFNFDGKGEVRVGGLMGAVMNDGTTHRVIESCYNTGDITVNLSEGMAVHNVGGIAGYLADGSKNKIINCYNTGDITVNANHGEVVVGNNFQIGIGSLIGTYAWKGGLSFENCGAGGTITFNCPNTAGSVLIGTFVGYVRDGSALTFGDGNTYSVAVTPDNPIGMFVGGTQPDNVTKVNSVTVPLKDGDIYFIGVEEQPSAPSNPQQPSTPSNPQQPSNPSNPQQPNETEPVTEAPTTPATTPAGNDDSGCASAINPTVLATVLLLGCAVALCTVKTKKEKI